ncbi:MAG TPA: hypothetical protein VGW34_12135 [Allosphingosinicella sp.]|nr:hypothetical protein [Allosphingosinicella sp.]
MALAALICAYQESDEPGGPLRATLPLAGRSLVERQARLAAAAGAERIIILVERLPPELAAAIDRMRSEGVSALVARGAAEAAQAVEPGDRLLLVADGLITGHSHIRRMAAADGAALLTMPDGAADDRFERIDAHSRWAGLALIDGALLRRTVALLDEWDLQSTLLRRAIQSGARQFALRADPGDEAPTIAERSSDLDEAETRIVEAAGAGRRGGVANQLLAPVERAATGILMSSAVTPEWLNLTAAALTGLAALLFTQHWLWAGGALLLLATPLDGIADRLAALRLQPGRDRGWRADVLPALAGAALLALAWSLWRSLGWGCLALAAATIVLLVALRGELAGADVPGKAWLAERKGMTWLMLPFALAGWWVPGLAALAVYAAGSFFWAQRQVHRRQQD